MKAARKQADDKEFHGRISSLESVIKKFLVANGDVVKTEELKAEITANRTIKVVNEAGELMEAAVASAQKDMKPRRRRSRPRLRRPTGSAWRWRSWW